MLARQKCAWLKILTAKRPYGEVSSKAKSLTVDCVMANSATAKSPASLYHHRSIRTREKVTYALHTTVFFYSRWKYYYRHFTSPVLSAYEKITKYKTTWYVLRIACFYKIAHVCIMTWFKLTFFTMPWKWVQILII